MAFLEIVTQDSFCRNKSEGIPVKKITRYILFMIIPFCTGKAVASESYTERQPVDAFLNIIGYDLGSLELQREEFLEGSSKYYQYAQGGMIYSGTISGGGQFSVRLRDDRVVRFYYPEVKNDDLNRCSQHDAEQRAEEIVDQLGLSDRYRMGNSYPDSLRGDEAWRVIFQRFEGDIPFGYFIGRNFYWGDELYILLMAHGCKVASYSQNECPEIVTAEEYIEKKEAEGVSTEALKSNEFNTLVPLRNPNLLSSMKRYVYINKHPWDFNSQASNKVCLAWICKFMMVDVSEDFEEWLVFVNVSCINGEIIGIKMTRKNPIHIKLVEPE